VRYKFARAHRTLRVTPAIEAGLSDRVWSIEELVALLERSQAMLRYSEVVVLALVISLVVWLNMPKLLWPAVVVAMMLCAVDRWHRGVYPWPPRPPS